jgi:dihydroxyacetone kinase-like protein
MTVCITTKDYIEYIEKVAKRIEENKDYITELDSITGDGDHWVNMNMGFQKLMENKELLLTLPLDALFQKIGMLIMSTVGGSSGVLYGSAYIKASKLLSNKGEIDIYLLSYVLEEKLKAIMERGNAKPGYKTMIDTLFPAVKNLKESLENGIEDYEALQLCKKAALEGMNSTREMEAVKGRACYQANKGVGHLDPGSVTMYYQLEELIDYVCSKW